MGLYLEDLTLCPSRLCSSYSTPAFLKLDIPGISFQPATLSDCAIRDKTLVMGNPYEYPAVADN
jgi:hypothetical protein